VRDTERLASRIGAVSPSGKGARKKDQQKDRDWTRVQDQISDAIGLPVMLRQGRGSRGELTIRFSNMDELDGVIALLAPEGLPED